MRRDSDGSSTAAPGAGRECTARACENPGTDSRRGTGMNGLSCIIIIVCLWETFLHIVIIIIIIIIIIVRVVVVRRRRRHYHHQNCLCVVIVIET